MSDELKRRLGERIRRRRRALGLSQAELAAAAETAQRHISRLENGLSNSTMDYLERIEAALRIFEKKNTKKLFRA